MMRKLVFIGLLLLMTVIPVQAVDGEYHLRVPSAAEYIERIAEIAQENPVVDWQTNNFYSAVTDLLFRRFPNLHQVGYQQILATYNAMGIGHAGYFPARGQWVEAILSAWLQQTYPDFESTDELRFDDFVIKVLPYDFDADGHNEYVLDILKGEPTDRYDCRYQAEYVNYLVVRLTDSSYQLVETPLYWEGYGTDSSVTNFGEGGQVEYVFEDINADGLPEWLVLIGGETFGGPAWGYENVGQLYILSWRDERLVDLAALGNGRQYPYSATFYGEESGVCDNAVPRDVTWEFTNIDDDPAQEILQHQVYQDNWQCIVRTSEVIDWDEAHDHYVQVDERRDFLEDSQNCARRQAEEAMWVGHYEEALEHYERALTLSPYIDPTENDPEIDVYSREFVRNRRITYDQYHMARMALAYQLTGQPEKARPILESLNEQEFSSEPIQYFVQALITAPDTPFRACLAAYTTFTQHVVTDLLGVTQEQYVGSNASYSPAHIGCDVMPMLANELNTRTFSTDTLPTEHVNSLGLSVRDIVHADLNGDGQDEWLVWTESPMNTFFFTPVNGNHYAVSTPAVDPFDHADEIHLWMLPDESGTAVAYLTPESGRYFPEPWACAYNPFCGRGGGGEECVPDGFIGLTVWRMEAQELVPILADVDVCRADFDALFPGGEASAQIDGGELIWLEDNSRNPIIYNWDTTSQTFVKYNTQVEPTPAPTSIPTPELQYRYFGAALDAGDYSAALTLIDQNAALERDYYQQNADARHAYQYQRAYILEALDRPDEALAEYVSIYETAPDSAWGMLAHLHFEVAD